MALLGRVVGFSGFMAVQGALRDSGYYDFAPPPSGGPGAAQEERPLWPELRTGGAPGEGETTGPGSRGAGARLAFLFYLGLRDPRVRLFRWLSSFGLEDKAAGRAGRVDGDRLVGDPALLDALDGAYRDWRRLGAPDMGRYAFRFVPATPGAAAGGGTPSSLLSPAAGPWALPGPYYRRVTTLPPIWTEAPG